MQINQKPIDQIANIGLDAKKTDTEVRRSSEFEEVTTELPKMSLETVMPKAKIIKPAKDFDLEKAIQNFNDISDTETIEKICKEWNKDLNKMSDEFLTKKLEKEGIYEKHQESLKSFDKYQLFSDKIYEAILSAPGNKREALTIFEKYIEPIIIRTQELLKTIDNIPEVKNAYVKTSTNSAELRQTPTVEIINKKPMDISEPDIAQTNSTIIDEIESEMTTINDYTDASRLITKLEANKDSMPLDKFEELAQKIINIVQKRG